jgi:hypothetical protein
MQKKKDAYESYFLTVSLIEALENESQQYNIPFHYNIQNYRINQL